MQDKSIKKLSSNPLLDPNSNNARSLVFTLSIVAYLATIALLFSVTMNRMSTSWNTALENSATIQILVENPTLREMQVEITFKNLKENYPNSEITVLDKKKVLRYA